MTGQMELNQERKIIVRILEGERNAYALLVDEYKKAIFNLAYRMTGSYEDARDLAQETFIRAYVNLNKFNREQRFFTWIYTVGLNLIRNHLKKKRQDRSRGTVERTFPKPGIGDSDRIEQETIRLQENDRLNIAMQKLPSDLREAIVLRFYQDLSFEEIAAISDASVSAVKMRVYRAQERLRALMEKE